MVVLFGGVDEYCSVEDSVFYYDVCKKQWSVKKDFSRPVRSVAMCTNQNTAFICGEAGDSTLNPELIFDLIHEYDVLKTSGVLKNAC